MSSPCMKEDNMKKLTALLLAMVMVLGLAACGEKPEETKPSEGSKATEADKPTEGTKPQESMSQAGTEQQTGGIEEILARRGGAMNFAYGMSSNNDIHKQSGGWGVYTWACYVYEPVITRDLNGDFQPGVCNFELSDDQLTFTLWVRDGVKFHNGEDCTIEDVVASLKRAGTIGNNVKKYFGQAVESLDPEIVEKDGHKCAVYKFKKYATTNLYYISGHQSWASVMPKSICDKYPEAAVMPQEDLIGTGAYKVAEYEEMVSMKLVRNEDYVPYNEGCTGLAAPKYAYFDTFTMLDLAAEDSTATMALLSGDYDAAMIDLEYKDMLLSSGNISMIGEPVTKFYMICFNTMNPETQVANDPNLRKAILAAIDYEELSKVEGDVNSLTFCPMEKGAYYTDAFVKADYFGKGNLELAKKYLAASNVDASKPIIITPQGSGITDIDTYLQNCVETLGLQCDFYLTSSWDEEIANSADSAPCDLTRMSSAVASFVPTTLVANVKDRFWKNERKDELFGIMGAEIVGSKGSLDAWNELVQLWVDEAVVAPTFETTAPLFYNKDLVVNFPTNWRTFWDCYWSNPAEH